MKKFQIMILNAVSIAVLAMPAAAIVLTPEAGVNVTSSYAKVVGGKVVFMENHQLLTVPRALTKFWKPIASG